MPGPGAQSSVMMNDSISINSTGKAFDDRRLNLARLIIPTVGNNFEHTNGYCSPDNEEISLFDPQQQHCP